MICQTCRGDASPRGPTRARPAHSHATLTEPDCVACHQLMDPLGLPLEKFDELGRRRHLDEGIVIDAVGELPDGRVVKGALGLSEALADDPRFIECVARRFLTYALAREPLPYEVGAVQELVASWAERDYRLGDLIELIVNHPLFLTRVPVGLNESREEVP